MTLFLARLPEFCRHDSSEHRDLHESYLQTAGHTHGRNLKSSSEHIAKLHPPFRTNAAAVGGVAHFGGEADALEKEVSAADEVAQRLVGDDAPPHRLPERHALRPLGGAHLQLPGEQQRRLLRHTGEPRVVLYGSNVTRSRTSGLVRNDIVRS